MRRWTEGVIRHRLLVVVLTAVVTVALALPIQRLRVQIDPSAMLPRMHPYVAATDRVDALFGGKYVVVIGVTPRTGDAFDPRVLAAVARMTATLGRVPGVVRGGVLSLASPRARGVRPIETEKYVLQARLAADETGERISGGHLHEWIDIAVQHDAQGPAIG